LDNWLTYADKAGMPESEALKIHRAMRREIVIPDARKTPASKPVSDASAP
jgi:serine/threonine-protein kinase HipA